MYVLEEIEYKLNTKKVYHTEQRRTLVIAWTFGSVANDTIILTTVNSQNAVTSLEINQMAKQAQLDDQIRIKQAASLAR